MIHPTAVIDPRVSLGQDVEIGPYARLEAGVSIGDGVRIMPYVHIKGKAVIGDRCFIATGAVIGEAPQIKGMKEKAGGVVLGKDNIIREYVTIHVSSKPDGVTSIGDDNFFMACSHVAHDCRIGHHTVVCNGALIAGHVELQDSVFISGNTTLHQFVRVGRLAMIGGLSRVNQDVPPFMMVVGDSRVWGINLVGIRRAGFSREDIADVKKAFQLLYRRRRAVTHAIQELAQSESPNIREITAFISASRRGVCGPQKNSLAEKLFLDYPYFVRTKIDAYEMLEKSRKGLAADRLE